MWKIREIGRNSFGNRITYEKKKKDEDRACSRFFFFAEKLSWSSKIRDPVFYNTEGERGDSGVK